MQKTGANNPVKKTWEKIIWTPYEKIHKGVLPTKCRTTIWQKYIMPHIKLPIAAIKPNCIGVLLNWFKPPILPNQNPHIIRPGIWVYKSALIVSKIKPNRNPSNKDLNGPWIRDQGNNQNIGQ